MMHYNYAHLLALMLTIYCISISSQSPNEVRKAEISSKIAIRVGEKGIQYILNESFRPLPDKILVNGKEIDQIDSKVNLEEKNSLIELIWNEPLTNCHEMFSEMSNITEINLTEFDSSEVTDMSSMFSKCKSLKKLEISNLKTSKVTNMEKMFEFCNNLEVLDLTNFDTSYVTNMDYLFHSCTNLKNLDVSKFNTSKVKSMMAMFAGCFSLEKINISYLDVSKAINVSYMLFDSDLVRLDLSNFMGSSIVFNDDTLKYNPNLKFIGLQNYKGKDIFNDLESDKEIIICENNETNYELNLPSLKEKNVINNCSDLCFYSFSKLKEDRNTCEIDCSEIDKESNLYYEFCLQSEESTIISDSINIEKTMLSDSTIDELSMLPESSNVEKTLPSSSTIDDQKVLPDSTNLESTEIYDSTINESTMLTDSVNIEPTMSSEITYPESTVLPETTNIPTTIPTTYTNPESTVLPETTNISTTIPTTSTNPESTVLPETTNIPTTITNPESTVLTETTNIPTTILNNNTNPKSTIIIENNIIQSTIVYNSTNSNSNKLKIFLYGYDSYSFRDNTISFSIYFMKIESFNFPRTIFFTIEIMFDYDVRNLVEQLNKNIECSLEGTNKLAKYNCKLNPEEKMDIKKITINYDFDFNNSYDLEISSLALFNKDKIVNRTDNFISSKELIILNGNLDQDNQYFYINGKLDENDKIDDKFNLTVYSTNSDQLNVSCETINENYNNLQIRCEKVRLTNFNVNNSISYMESKQLLVIIEDGESDLVEAKIISGNNKYNYKENSSLSGGIIAAIVVVIVVVLTIIALIIIFRKKLFNKKEASIKDSISDTVKDFKITETTNN